MNELNGSQDSAEIDVDQLLADIEAPRDASIPMHSPQEETQVEAAPQPAQKQQEQYQIQWNGKTIDADIDRIKQWAQQGYDYAQKMADFKNQQNIAQREFESKRQQYEQRFKQYEEIDQYAQQNPQWWQLVQQQWQNRASDPSAEINPIISQELSTLKQELNDLRQFKTDLVTKEQQKVQVEEDKKLDSEIESMRKQYSYLDWDTKNERGDNLEFQVLRYANERGINDFAAAFKLYNHDRLVSIAEERGKEASVKSLKKQTKLGQLGKFPASNDKISTPKSVREKSYDDLVEEALSEFSSGA